MILVIFSIWNLTKHNPLEDYFLSWKSSIKGASIESFCTFIERNIDKNSIIFVNGKDPFLSMQLSFCYKMFWPKSNIF